MKLRLEMDFFQQPQSQCKVQIMDRAGFVLYEGVGRDWHTALDAIADDHNGDRMTPEDLSIMMWVRAAHEVLGPRTGVVLA